MNLRNFIQSSVKRLLNEVAIDTHFSERLKDRILDQSVVNVGYELPNTRGQYRIVGTYTITPSMKTLVTNAYNKLRETKFGKNKSVAVKILDLWINPKEVQYSVDPKEAAGMTLVVVDEKTNSNGNRVYAIVRADMATTLFFAKSYVTIDPQKLNVDYILNKF